MNLNSIQICTRACTAYSLPNAIKMEERKQIISLRRDVCCQTDFPYESAGMEDNDDAIAVESSKSNRQAKVTHNFCWRHDAYKPWTTPARPSSPVSNHDSGEGICYNLKVIRNNF